MSSWATRSESGALAKDLIATASFNFLDDKQYEMKVNELEQANGGDFIDDVKDVLKKLDPFKDESIIPDPVIAKKRKWSAGNLIV